MIDFTSVIQAFIVLLSVIITSVLIPLIRSHMSVTHCAKIQIWAKIAVEAAEQIYQGSGRGTEKKNYVIKFLNQQGLTYDEAAIDALIESSVKMLNIAQDNTKKDAPAQDFDDLK
ncbi:MAG: phage holin, LLH family [Eubacteriales bacterium]